MSLSDAEREALYAQLTAHVAADHIDLAELERRIGRLHAAGSLDEAWAVVDDLPRLGAGRAPADPGRPRWGRGHGEADRARADWRPTAERFRDPRTQRVMRVWEDGDGGRHYVADDG